MVSVARCEDFGDDDSGRGQRIGSRLDRTSGEFFQGFAVGLVKTSTGGKMRIAVIGSGYVGLVSAACFAEIGHEVISVDNDAAKITALERGEVPIHEHFL